MVMMIMIGMMMIVMKMMMMMVMMMVVVIMVMMMMAMVVIIFLMGYVEERLWWPIRSPNKGRKKVESKQLRGERDQIKFIDLRFERWQVVGLRKARRR